MAKTIHTIDALDTKHKQGMFLTGEEFDGERQTTQNGQTSTFIRKVEFMYDLKLQHLTSDQLMEIKRELFWCYVNDEEIEFLVDDFNGYLDFRDTGVPSFAVDYQKSSTEDLEDGYYNYTVKITDHFEDPAGVEPLVFVSSRGL